MFIVTITGKVWINCVVFEYWSRWCI